MKPIKKILLILVSLVQNVMAQDISDIKQVDLTVDNNSTSSLVQKLKSKDLIKTLDSADASNCVGKLTD